MNTCHNAPINWDAVAAIGTMLAVFVTLLFSFIGKISRWWGRPVLNMFINLGPPECSKTTVKLKKKDLDAWYFRLHVENSGRSAAKGIEVTIERVLQEVNNKWKVYKDFLPSSLYWTHLGYPILPNLLPGTFKNVDLGYIPLNPEGFALFDNDIMVSESLKENRFNVTIIPSPKKAYNILHPGTYKFTISIGAENCKPIQKNIVLKFSKEWESDDSQVLGKSIELSIV